MTSSSNTFKCEACGVVYTKIKSDEEAKKDSEAIFGSFEDVAVVCDDCFKRGISKSPMRLNRYNTHRLVEASKELIKSISFDDCGTMIGGHWQGGNGGMISRETLAKTDALRRALAAFENGEA